MSLSNKLSKLEETIRICQSKNLYLQEENQCVKLINEGKGQYQPAQPNVTNSNQTSSNESSARLVVLENENITNKIKLVEENLKSQLNLLKLEFETKLSI